HLPVLRWVSDAVRVLLERGFVYRISTRYSGKNPWAYRCSSKHDPSAYCHAGEGSLLLPRPSGRARNLVGPLRPEASPGVPGPASQVVNQSIAEGERLTEEDRRSLEAYSVGVITATRFARYREDVRRRLRVLGELRGPLERDVSEYVRAAREMPFRTLLRFAGMEIIVLGEEFLRVRLFATGVVNSRRVGSRNTAPARN